MTTKFKAFVPVGRIKRGRVVAFGSNGATMLKRKKKSYVSSKLFEKTSAVETKFFDAAQTASPISATGAMGAPNLFGIVEGDTDKTRNGRKIVLKSLDFRYIVTLPSTATLFSNDLLRVIIGIDHQSNGAVNAVLDILETATILSYRNLANVKRFTVFHDKFTMVNFAAGGPASTTTTRFAENEEYISFRRSMNLQIDYDASAGGIGDLTSNNIFVLLISQNGIAGITFNLRYRFVDL